MRHASSSLPSNKGSLSPGLSFEAGAGPRALGFEFVYSRFAGESDGPVTRDRSGLTLLG